MKRKSPIINKKRKLKRRKLTPKKEAKIEGEISIIAALIVLFSSLWVPLVSIILAIIILVVYAVYQFRKSMQ